MIPQNPREDSILAALDRISERLERLSEKLDQVLENQSRTFPEERRPSTSIQRGGPPGYKTLDVMTLLSLPDHLRKAAMAVCEKGSATAAEVSQQTKRARAVESSYLNQLVNLGHLKKEKKQRTVYFSVSE
jgi:hypothetical protein